MKHVGYIRNFESTLVALGERGHDVRVALGQSSVPWLERRPEALARLTSLHDNVSFELAPAPRGLVALVGRKLRTSLDYLRYLEPEYRMTPRLRARAARKAPLVLRALTLFGLVRSPRALAPLQRLLAALERRLPTRPALDAFIRSHEPDSVLVTPLVDFGSPQSEYLRSARAIGVPTGLCVASWDNLTNKGLIHVLPDLVTVWNEAQKQEAVRFHAVPAERVAVTGAQPYDQWFDWGPGTTREEFCERVQLPADRPYVLYLCSSPFIGPDEASFVTAWAERLRRADPPLSELGILVRPHPQNAAQWSSFDATRLGPLSVYPRAGADPVDEESRGAFYDSIHHAAAIVGLNTSALIESAIVGRPVLTVLAPGFEQGQVGTLHFKHLVTAGGGMVRTSTSLAEHLDQLSAALEEGASSGERHRGFLEAFVRPNGLDQAATPMLVEAVERTASASRQAPAPASAEIGTPAPAGR